MTNPIAEFDNGVESWPISIFLWNFRMIVAVVRVVNMRVDASLTR